MKNKPVRPQSVEGPHVRSPAVPGDGFTHRDGSTPATNSRVYGTALTRLSTAPTETAAIFGCLPLHHRQQRCRVTART